VIGDAESIGSRESGRSSFPGASKRSRLHRYGALFLGLWIGLIGVYAQSADTTKPQPPATILLIRHAEKMTDGNEDLSSAGFDRAGLLPKAFSPAAGRPGLPTPQVLFAARISSHSNRSVQTITPLAQALHLPIDDRFSDHDYQALAAALLSGQYAGKVVLIAWHRGRIPQLAAALGAKPPYDPWPEQQFDRIWRIDYSNGNVTIQDLPYSIMPGDSK
jgi:hypothetical protein